MIVVDNFFLSDVNCCLGVTIPENTTACPLQPYLRCFRGERGNSLCRRTDL